uniref:Cytoplasmic protein n=1 Tax=Kwoniella bestiolae CBS 10118 TaxID=1296100 RepID=A0A1B9GG72_9TREE|nr:cytoplasmic protein [Kwoniella bestiolae CBS 10118]OCF30026.1 cytoplasmic protein [Kwoniella bestiolae CBS 10118]
MSSDHNHADAPSFPLTHLTAQDVQIQGRHFVDPHGRVLNLRGANVSGSSKVPIPKIHEHAQVNYINRPFPLEEADLHWRRLKSWGMTFLRITVTWEAVEHEGQGVYDEGYLEYLRKFLESMEKYGLVAYIAIHQDVWSRYSGGSGAPGWTMASAGFDLSDDGEKLALSGAAFLDGIKGGRLGGERGLWPTGYQKLAAATMNTLFWGGETFAPSLKVPTTTSNGRTTKVNIQTYLQDAFLKMFERLVDAVGDVGSVMGFELMNEPHPGYIGLPSIHEWNYNTDLHLGQFPSPLQSFSMGSGRPTDNVPIYKRSFPWPTTISSYSTGNPEGVSAWTKGQEGCIWEKEGIWRWSDNKNIAVALQEDYFTKDRSGRKVDFYEDFYFPFVQKWNAVLARTQKLKQKGDGDGLMRMVEMIPNEFCPEYDEAKRPDNMVYAPHWYDLNALFKKQFGYMTVNVQGLSRGMFLPKALYFGPNGAKANYAKQIQTIVLEARLKLGALPVIIGECGVPMDLNNEYALKTGDWKAQQQMMDAMISALESANVGFNLWTYNPANRDDIGDDWNAENFSWYSDHNRSIALKKSDNDGEEDLDAGGRLMDVIVRPYAIATAGTPLSSSYDAETALFTHRFTSPIRISTDIPSIEEVTEIFLPKRVYTEGQVRFALSLHGKIYFDWPNQRCWVWFDDPPYHHSIDLGPRGTKENKVRRVDIWVPGRTKPRPWTTLHLLGIVLFFVVAVLGILKAQEIEWDKEDSALRFHRPGSRSWFKT